MVKYLSSFPISEMSSPINFCKSEFHYFFSPAYGRRIWDFSRAHVNAIRQAVNCLDWDMAFNGLNLDERVNFLTECVLNFFYKLITIRTKDRLWMTPAIKRIILEKAIICRCQVKHGQSIAE